MFEIASLLVHIFYIRRVYGCAIKDTDLKSLSNISSEMKTLAARAKENKLRLD